MASKARRDELIARMEHLGPVAEGWVKNLQADKCPICGKEVDYSDFRDDLSRKEYDLTHMCQACQDVVFKPPEDDL